MPNKSVPQLGDSNWGTPLNAHLAQLQNPNNGGINTFEQFSGRPTNLTTDDAGKTYLYTQTGNLHQWTGTSWKVLNESVINVKDYGAIGDGVADDVIAIQNCLDFFIGKIIFLPKGIFIITKPLILPSNTVLRGSSTIGTNIKKTTGSSDSNGIQSVLILKSNPSYNSDSSISDLFLLGDYAEGGILKSTDYGIFADKCSTLKLDKVSITNCKTGFYSSDCFLTFISNINIFECNLGITILGGTSLTANTVYCKNCAVGYNLKYLKYSTLNSCAVDGASYLSYYFEVCQGITLNSCGAEGGDNSNGYSVFSASNSNIVINAPFIVSSTLYEKGVFYTQNKSQVLLNNPTLIILNPLNKFITAETNSLVTLDELYNTAADLVSQEAYSKTDKFVELTGGIINIPNKQPILDKYQKLIKSVAYNSDYPVGNNNYNENLQLNIENEINNLTGNNWKKASISFQGNDGTTNTGYILVQGFQTNGIKKFILISGNGGATLSGNTISIPTTTNAGGGYWYFMEGIYEITISV
jgi:Pectate lyase superfamily protein